MEWISSWLVRRNRLRSGASGTTCTPISGFFGEAVKVDINHGRGVQRKNLAEQQAADHRDSEWTTQLGADSCAERERQATEQRGHGGHHDRAEAQQASFEDGFLLTFSLPAPRPQKQGQ